MRLNTYQSLAGQTAIYPGQGTDAGLAYVTLGLAGEAGEVANKVKKLLRDGQLDSKVADEVGDVLWYLAMLCDELGTSLEKVADRNLAKLQDRAERGALRGSDGCSSPNRVNARDEMDERLGWDICGNCGHDYRNGGHR